MWAYLCGLHGVDASTFFVDVHGGQRPDTDEEDDDDDDDDDDRALEALYRSRSFNNASPPTTIQSDSADTGPGNHAVLSSLPADVELANLHE